VLVGPVAKINPKQLPRTKDVHYLGQRTVDAVRRIGVTYGVRGQPEKITSYTAPTPGEGGVVNQVRLVYNAFGLLTTDYQEHAGAVNLSTSPRVGYTYSDGTAGHVRRTRMVYPNGRVLRYEYRPGADEQLNRVSFLADDAGGTVGTHLVEYQRLGLNTFVQTDYPQPGLRCDLAHGTDSAPYVGLDPFDRIVDLRWWNPSTGVDVERIQHGYDRAGNRLWRQCPVAESYGKHFDELYRYDGVDQLVSLDRGDLNTDKSALVSGTQTFAEAWTLDATGNWLRYRQDTDGDGIWNLDQSRDHNAANEILAIAGSSAHVAHDRAGNMTRIPSPLTGEGQGEGASHHTLTYDAWNRLVRVADGATGQTLAEYDYDGRSFRTVKRSYTSGALTETRHSFYSVDWQVLEERVGTSTTADRQFVWGLRYIDGLVLRDRDSGLTGMLGERFYAFQDPNWSVTTITEADGNAVERYSYHAYGKTSALSPTFLDAAVDGSWEMLFTGRPFDSATGKYDYRARTYIPELGEFPTRDPIGFSEGMNLYEYVGDSPLARTDPSGLVGGGYDGPPGFAGRPLRAPRSDSPFCRSLARKIDNIDHDIKKRLSEYREDPLGLPERAPGDKQCPRLSRWGHRKLINVDKARLALLQGIYNWKCRDDNWMAPLYPGWIPGAVQARDPREIEEVLMTGAAVLGIAAIGAGLIATFPGWAPWVVAGGAAGALGIGLGTNREDTDRSGAD
jgi:RHS repeat-associated protein